MNTKRIEIEGDYAIVLSEMKHKTTRLVREECRKYMKPKGKPMSLADIQAGAPILTDFEIDTQNLDTEHISEIILLNQVTEWSFGAVNQSSLDDIPTSKYEKLKTEVDKLYGASPLPENAT